MIARMYAWAYGRNGHTVHVEMRMLPAITVLSEAAEGQDSRNVEQ